MNVYAPIILCFVPFVTVFVLFAILVPKISVGKEFAASLAGLLALIPITLAQFFIPGMSLFGQTKALSILLYSLIFLGLIEETFKALMLLTVGAKGQRLGHWVCYSFLAGLIFGSFESVIYFFNSLQKIENHILTINLIYMRMGTAVLVHALCSVMGGYFVFYKKNVRKNLWPLFEAILIHGLYDYFVSFTNGFQYLSVVVILFAAWECRVVYLRIREEMFNNEGKSTAISDPNKTIAIPKNPAIVIPGKTTVTANGLEEIVVAEEVPDEEAEDFDAIESQAKAELKAQGKRRASATAKKTGAAKASSTKKAGVTKTKTASAKKDSAKTAAKTKTKTATKTTTKSAEKKTASKTAAPKKTSATKTRVSSATKAAPKKTASTKKTAGGKKDGKRS